MEVVVGDGFGNPQNYAPGGLAVLGDWLYASINNPNSTQVQVWRSNSGNGGTWSKIFEIGLSGSGTGGHTGLIVYGNDLYLTVYNYWSGMQVWRSGDGVNWRQIGFEGFGDSNNETSMYNNGLKVFNDALYIGVNNYANGAELWRIVPPSIYLPLVRK
jgi:hypothetical protein